MHLYKRTMVVSHHPPHEWIPYDVGTSNINTIKALRYAILHYKNPTNDDCKYANIMEDNNIDGSKQPTQIPLPTLGDLPKMTMFNYDRLFTSTLSFKLGQLPTRRPRKNHDIVFNTTHYQSLYRKNTLFTVGGLIHRTVFVGNKGYIRDGGLTSKKSRTINRLYLPYGSKWKEYSITAENAVTHTTLYEDCVIELRHPPGPGEVPIFIIGGYMEVVGHNMVTALSSQRYKIDFTGVFAERMMDIDGYIAESLVIDNMININKLKRDDFIKQILNASQTFVIILKAQSITQHIYPTMGSTIAGRYKVTHKPSLPLVTGRGGLIDYRVEEKCGCYEVLASDDRIRRYLTHPAIGKVSMGLDPTDLVWRRTGWLAIYIKLNPYIRSIDYDSDNGV